MSRLARLGIFCAAWASLAGCASGVNTTVCIVDAANEGFQCVYNGEKEGLYVPLDKGKDLLCASPGDTEDFLKACKQHQLLAITLCSYDGASFLCKDARGYASTISVDAADNYFCLSPKDRKRLLERCK